MYQGQTWDSYHVGLHAHFLWHKYKKLRTFKDITEIKKYMHKRMLYTESALALLGELPFTSSQCPFDKKSLHLKKLKNYLLSFHYICLCFPPTATPTPAKATSLPCFHPPPWFSPCVLYSSS